MCSGCGACAYLQPDALQLIDVLHQGRRPVPRDSAVDPDTTQALAGCPGHELGHPEPPSRAASRGEIPELAAGWGPVLELYEGYAADPDLRRAGSSGGIATALAEYAIGPGELSGVLHIKARSDVPYLNETTYSTSVAQLRAATGSRYAPASPCDRLDLIEAAPRPSVFIGKPCDVAATAKARTLRPRLDERLGLTIALFCAGTPSTAGTLEMLRVMGIEPADVMSLHYRGNGWPGDARATARGRKPEATLSYEDSWGAILQRHRQWRCYVCADHTGEFADIAVGDPWYRPTDDDPGRSLVLVRTQRGRDVLRAAMNAGVVVLEPVAPALLPASQPNLLRTRGAVFGRIATLRLMGVGAPRFTNMPTLRYWRALPLREKLRSTVGTAKRIRSKRLRHAPALTPYLPPPVDSDDARAV